VYNSSHICVGNNFVVVLLVLGVLDRTLSDKVCQWLATDLWISLGTPISATKVVTEILLKVALSTIKTNIYDMTNELV
jgi:hypothetical protein